MAINLVEIWGSEPGIPSPSQAPSIHTMTPVMGAGLALLRASRRRNGHLLTARQLPGCLPATAAAPAAGTGVLCPDVTALPGMLDRADEGRGARAAKSFERSKTNPYPQQHYV